MPTKLNKREGRTLRAAAECILPAGGRFPYGHADIDSVGWINDEYFPAVPKEVQILLRLILLLVEYAGWVYTGLPGRFSRMPLERRNLFFERARHSRIYVVRGFFILLSTVLLLPFYSDPRVMDAIGYFGYRPEVNKVQGESA
jgi:hypothetical protein